MPVPIVYRAGGDVQVNYDFADIISGTGFFNLYLAHALDDSGASTYFATRDVGFMSNTVITENTDLNFDYTLDRPLTIHGDVTVNLNWGGTYPAGGSGNGVVTVKLQKWDGSTATDLGDANSGSVLVSGSSQSYFYSGLVIPITTPQHLKKGESIRIRFEKTHGGNPNVQLAHDPADRTSWGAGSDVTASTFARIPLRLNI
jgi:hypothetical protein